ncbi:MAG: DUF4349 domain-containing protein [Patescibacteria group bacterium]|jgi:hypothetical protein
MRKIIDWIKRNKLTCALILVVVYLVVRRTPIANVGLGGFGGISSDAMYSDEYAYSTMEMAVPSAKSYSGSGGNYLYRQAAPQLAIQDRMIVTNTNLSIVVKDVVNSIELIKNKTKELNGYMVNSWVNSPEEGGTGYISLRIPSDKLDAAMKAFRGFAVKIVDESIDGTDITDQYTDYEEQLRILEGTKVTFEGIIGRATEVEDILNVQDRILNVQSQIDSIKGQLKYMEATASSSLISVNLSTDELSLPYAPSTWRPQVVFKYATRALVQDLRKIANTSIWVGVYAVIWLPVLAIVYVVRKMILKRRANRVK